MATLNELPGVEDFVRDAVENLSLCHTQVSALLKAAFPSLRGLSTASVKRFCMMKGIHKTARLDQSTLERLVLSNVMRVSPNAFIMLRVLFLLCEF